MEKGFTYAFFIKDGTPNRRFRYNFSHYPGSLADLLRNLQETMVSPTGNRDSHVAAVWKGRLTEAEAMGPHTRPVAKIYNDGHVKREERLPWQS